MNYTFNAVDCCGDELPAVISRGFKSPLRIWAAAGPLKVALLAPDGLKTDLHSFIEGLHCDTWLDTTGIRRGVYLVGKTKKKATPYIILSEGDVKARNELCDRIKRIIIRRESQFAGFSVCAMADPPELRRRITEQTADELSIDRYGPTVDRPLTQVFYDDLTLAFKIRIPRADGGSRLATAGAFFSHGDDIFALTAAHAFFDQQSPVTTPDSVHASEVYGMDYSDDSDDDSDMTATSDDTNSSSFLETLRNGSNSPRNVSQRNSLSRSPHRGSSSSPSDFDMLDNVEGYEAHESSTHSQNALSASSECVNPDSKPRASIGSLFGHLVYPLRSEASKGLDFALIKVTCPKALNFVRRHVVQGGWPHMMSSSVRREESVILIKSDGVERRGIIGGMASWVTGRENQVEEIWDAKFPRGSLTHGDCGSIVIESVNRQVFGFVFEASSDGARGTILPIQAALSEALRFFRMDLRYGARGQVPTRMAQMANSLILARNVLNRLSSLVSARTTQQTEEPPVKSALSSGKGFPGPNLDPVDADADTYEADIYVHSIQDIARSFASPASSGRTNQVNSASGHVISRDTSSRPDTPAPTAMRSGGLESPLGDLHRCPFFKNNPDACHQTQSSTPGGWQSLDRLKDHILRCHRERGCPHCDKRFATEASLDLHLRDISYNGPAPSTDGTITDGQARQLKSKSVVAWKQVYRIIFPELDRDKIPSQFHEPSGTQLQ